MTKAIDRRGMLGVILFGGVAATGLALTPGAIQAMPLDDTLARGLIEPIEKAQAVVVGGGRRRRRWVCWWNRGRRVCGWRWR